jgi:hypothetical protein
MENLMKLTNVEIYLIWLNDYLTTEKMAEHYGVSVRILSKLVALGRNEFLSQNETERYKTFWGIN